MSMEALQRAKDGLHIQDVFLYSSTSKLSEGFDPKFDSRIHSLELELRNVPKRSYLIEGDSNGEEVAIFRVELELGARQILPSEGEDEGLVAAQVEATFMADYIIADPNLREDREALDAFAMANASYHVWPFWREYLSSQVLRMNLPKIMLPMLNFQSTKKAEK